MADNDAPNNYDQQNDKPKADLITVQVKSGGDGVEVYFKIKKTTHFRKVFESYLERVGKAQGSMRFLFDGTPIQPTSTPNDIGLDDNHVIDAMAEQTGGAGAIVQS